MAALATAATILLAERAKTYILPSCALRLSKQNKGNRIGKRAYAAWLLFVQLRRSLLLQSRRRGTAAAKPPSRNRSEAACCRRITPAELLTVPSQRSPKAVPRSDTVTIAPLQGSHTPYKSPSHTGCISTDEGLGKKPSPSSNQRAVTFPSQETLRKTQSNYCSSKEPNIAKCWIANASVASTEASPFTSAFKKPSWLKTVKSV